MMDAVHRYEGYVAQSTVPPRSDAGQR